MNALAAQNASGEKFGPPTGLVGIIRLHVTVSAIQKVAANVLSLELRPAGGETLPAFEPGAHIDLQFAEDLVRSYSLINVSAGNLFKVAVLLDENSRGGSRFIHEKLAVGTSITTSAPRNHFTLHEGSNSSILIAGGIGITPILSMHRRLRSLGRTAKLLYCARSRSQAPFVDELKALGQADFHFDDEVGGPRDLHRFLESQDKDSDFYCCGPTGMINAFEGSARMLDLQRAHVERFSASSQIESVQDASYQVFLARDGRTIVVSPGTTLLDALHDAGIEVDCACKEGICGACETRVLEGVPDHRDSVLSEAERAAGKTMLVCVSGSIGKRLVLDL